MRFIVFVAGLNMNKRPPDVVDALALVAHNDARLVVLRESLGPPRAEPAIGRVCLSERVRPKGSVGQVQAVHRRPQGPCLG